MAVRTITKLDVAVSQLRHAIELFIEGKQLISVITLAGASEEILGKLAERAGQTAALERRTHGARAIFEHIWKSDPGSQLFHKLKNNARNELKHLRSGDPLRVDLEQEAVRILDRAVENYKLLHVRAAPFIREYERQRHEGSEAGEL